MDADIANFLIDCKSRNLRPATVEAYRLQLIYFARWATKQGITDLRTVNASTIRAYFADQLDRDLSPYTVRMSGRCLRAWFNWAISEELLTDSPMRKVKFPQGDVLDPDFFTPDEVRLLLDLATVRDRALVTFLLDTGARLGETAALAIPDIDLPGGAVRLHANVKTRRPRTVYLGTLAGAAMAAWLEERPALAHPALWVQANGIDPLTRNGVQEAIKRLGRRAEVHPCAPHKFRRTNAMWSLRSGMDSDTVAKLLGHADDKQLRFYAQLRDDDLQRAHAAHSPVDRFLK